MNIKVTICILLALSLAYTQGNSCCSDNTITVSGKGVASALPDKATITISFNEKGTTSADAVKALAKKVNQAIAILKANGYNSSSYQTGSLNVYPEYSYTNGKSQIVGQQAQQSLTVTVLGLDSKGTKVGTLVDALAQVNGLTLSGVSFDINDKTPLQTQARATAFSDAKTKASDYAGFAGLNAGRVLKIEDSSYVAAPPQVYNSKVMALAGAAADSRTQVPLGTLDVTYDTTITFALQ